MGQGKENVRQFLTDNPDLADEIENKILAEMGLGDPVAEAEAEMSQVKADSEFAEPEL